MGDSINKICSVVYSFYVRRSNPVTSLFSAVEAGDAAASFSKDFVVEID